MQSLDAPASSLSLSQTISDIRFGERNAALLRTDNTECHSVRLIIMKLEQVLTHRNAIFFQLVYPLIFTDQSVYSYISNCSWNCTPPPNPR